MCGLWAHNSRNSILEIYDLPLEKITYLAPYFFEKDSNGQTRIYYPSFIGIVIDSFTIVSQVFWDTQFSWFFQIFSIFIACHYALKCHRTLQKLLSRATVSNKLKRIHSQFFYSLVTQTLIPVILMHIPVGMNVGIIFAFTGQDVGSLCGIVCITIALYPALDPIPTILIVKDYRKALFDYICGGFLTVTRKPMRMAKNATRTWLQSLIIFADSYHIFPKDDYSHPPEERNVTGSEWLRGLECLLQSSPFKSLAPYCFSSFVSKKWTCYQFFLLSVPFPKCPVLLTMCCCNLWREQSMMLWKTAQLLRKITQLLRNILMHLPITNHLKHRNSCSSKEKYLGQQLFFWKHKVWSTSKKQMDFWIKLELVWVS